MGIAWEPRDDGEYEYVTDGIDALNAAVQLLIVAAVAITFFGGFGYLAFIR
jgi:hypothetical protein